MRRFPLFALALNMLTMNAQPPGLPSVDLRHGDLQVAPNHRFLMHADGTPFFWLGDTAWELFHRLNREDAARYLENRRAKRFTVIQAVVLAELDGLDTPNAYGDRPLIDDDPLKPNERYFRHVDWIVSKAAEQGLFIAMLPTWGNHVVKATWDKAAPKPIFNEANARAYGRWLGARYRGTRNLVWVLGGDRDPRGVQDVWRALAEGIREGDGGRHLMTFHPPGGQSSSVLHEERWLDFNMSQSGHGRKDLPNFRFLEHDYALQPTKPALDGEARYEDHPVNWDPDHLGWFDDYDTRQAAYWAVFAGGFGHTYGCHPIWQMLTPERKAVGFARHNWYDVLDLPGASQMRHLRGLMESRPLVSRVPDQNLVPENQAEGPEHLEAARGDGYAFVYIPTGAPVRVDLTRLSAGTLRCWWFDPRTGKTVDLGTRANNRLSEFIPPGEHRRGNDWVLVIDDASRSFPPPGSAH